MEKSRKFIFTWNNYPETAKETLENIWKMGKCLYICAGKEIAPTTQTPHLQGFIHFKNAILFKSVTKMLDGCHITIANGSPEQNFIYCTKDQDFFEWGELQSQGKRNDLATIKQAIRGGKQMEDVIEIATSYQSLKTAELLLKYIEKPRDFKPDVRWYHGTTGSGKTKSAFEEFPKAWVSAKDLKWWDGYDGHKTVIFDDFRKDFCTFHELLRILDRYPYRVQTKGGSRQLVATTIIITSCYHPADIYETREDLNQLLRRISSIKHFVTQNTEVGGNNSPDSGVEKIDIKS